MEKSQRFIREEDVDKHQLDQKIADWVHQWAQRTLSTEPADHERVERSIRDILLAAGRSEDMPIVWTDSPVVMFTTIRAADVVNGYSGNKKNMSHIAALRSVERYFKRVIQSNVSPELAKYIRKKIENLLFATIYGRINNVISVRILSTIFDIMYKTAFHYYKNNSNLDEMRKGYELPHSALYQSTFCAVDYALGGKIGADPDPMCSAANDGKVFQFEDAADIAIRAALHRIEQQYCVDYRRYLRAFLRWIRMWSIERWDPITYHGINLVYYTFFRNVFGLSFIPKRGRVKGKDLLQAYEDVMSVGWTWFDERFVVVCEPPITLRTERAADGSCRLHATDGPAVAWRDGTALWFIRDVCVPRYVVEAPETITAKQALRERNAELRRVMIDRIGAERYLREIGGTGQHEDTDQYGFPRRLLVANIKDIEPLCAVEVVNATPEPIGYTPDEWEHGIWVGNRWHKKYMLRVPPSCQTTQEAIAWTFGLDAESYRPEIET